MSQIPDHIPSLSGDTVYVSTSEHTPAFEKQYHRFLAAIVNASDDAILSKTLDGIITTWNPAAGRMFGYTAEEIIGRPKTVLFPPERLQEEQVILDRLRQGISTNHFETVRLHRDGTPIHVSVTISPIKDEHGQVIGASTIAHNITERKQNEEQVRLLSTVASESINGIAITDAQRRILYVNPAYERLTGYTLEELHGRRPGDVLQGPKTDQETKQRVREALDAKHPVMAELLNYRKDGTPYWIEIHITPVKNRQGEVTHFIAIETDITHRIQAETTIRQHHDKMAALLEAIPDSIFRVNREGICLDNLGSNKPFALVTTQDVVGRPLSDFSPPHVGEIVRSGIDAALATQRLQTLQYQVSLDGKMHHRDTRIVAQSEDVALILIRDVTESKEMEEELRQSEARFHAFMNQGSLCAWITDAEGVVEYLNQPYCAMIGRTLEECVGKTPFDLYPAEVAQVMLDNIQQVARTGEILETVEIAPVPDGMLHHFLVHKFLLGEMSGRVLVGGLAVDITERRRMEKELREITTLQQAIFDSADYSIISTDVQGTIMSFNRAAEHMIGYSAEEIVGKVTPAIFHDADEVVARAESLTQELGRSIAPGFEVFVVRAREGMPDENEWTYIRKDGSRFPVRLSATALRNEAGVLTGYLGIAQDITARVEAEQTVQDNVKRQGIIIAAQQDILNAGHDLNAVIQSAVEHCQSLTAADGAIVELIDGDETVFSAVSGIASPLLGMRLQLQNSLSGQSIQENQILYCEDTELDNPIHREAFRRAGIRSLVVVPLQQDGQAIGVLKVLSARPSVFIEKDRVGLQLIAGFLSSAMLTAVTARDLRQNEERLMLAQQLAQMGSWEYDFATGKIAWSAEMFRLLDLDVELGEPDYLTQLALYHPEDAALLAACVQRAITESLDYELDLRRTATSGQPMRWFHAVGKVARNETGQAVQLVGTLADITERVMAMQEQTKFVSLIENSSDFIAMVSLDGILLTLNPAGCQLVGLESAEDITTAMLPDFMPVETWNRVRQEVLPVVMRDDGWEGECQLVNVAKGKVHDMQASFFLIRNPVSGEPMCLATVQRDITSQKWLNTQLEQNLVLVQEQNVQLELQRQELASANAHLEALATTDGLTGAKNHRAFQEKLSEEFNRIERTHRPFSVILLDVDKFKQYNDTYGHLEGDRVLKQVVKVLQETARQTDFVARYGGEEFIILLLETGVEGAIQAAERFRAAIAAQDWPFSQVTASFGVATLNDMMETGHQLVDMADRALYASKEGGRNRATHANAIPYLPISMKEFSMKE